MPTDFITSLTQFGVAGLMGVLWVWERTLSRRRDQQLNETHDTLMRERDALRVLIRLVRRNTEAIERFERTQERLLHLLIDPRENEKPKPAKPEAPNHNRQISNKFQIPNKASNGLPVDGESGCFRPLN